MNEKLKAAKEATGYERSKQRREAAITAAQEKVDKQKEYIAELEQKATHEAEEDAARKLEQEEAKRRRKAEEEDATRNWSEAGVLAVTVAEA